MVSHFGGMTYLMYSGIKPYLEISYNKYHYSEVLKYYVIFSSNFYILEPNK